MKQVAWQATPSLELELEHGRRVALVCDQQLGAGMRDRARDAVDADGSGAGDDGPDLAGLVGTAVRALLIGCRDDDQRVRVVGRAQRRDRIGACLPSRPSSSWIASSVSA